MIKQAAKIVEPNVRIVRMKGCKVLHILHKTAAFTQKKLTAAAVVYSQLFLNVLF